MVTEFQIAKPPKVAGLYALVNRTRQLIYIGQSVNLRQRAQEWSTLFTMCGGCRNTRLSTLIRETPVAEWTFNVLRELPGADRATLMKAEGAAILAALRVRPREQVLNVTIAYAPGESSLRKSRIVTVDGNEINYSEAIVKLECSEHTFVKRLQYWRRKGVLNWQLRDGNLYPLDPVPPRARHVFDRKLNPKNSGKNL